MAIPTPAPGLVLHYGYLWHHEHRAGHDEGRKVRPAVIVLCVQRDSDDSTIITVLPVTHVAPANSNSAIEIPHAIKKHLGLDDARSWIVVSEGNEFAWPGYDLRKIPKTGRYDFGFLPPRLFNQITEAFLAFYRAGQTKMTPRDDV